MLMEALPGEKGPCVLRGGINRQPHTTNDLVRSTISSLKPIQHLSIGSNKRPKQSLRRSSSTHFEDNGILTFVVRVDLRRFYVLAA